MTASALSVVLLTAFAVGGVTALAAVGMLWIYLGYGTLKIALKASCVLLATAVLIQSAGLFGLRLTSPDISLKWFLIPMILGEGVVVGLVGFFALDPPLRIVALAISAMAPLMLMCVGTIET